MIHDNPLYPSVYVLKHYFSFTVKHLGELPYKCDECNEAFNRRDKLVKHIDRTHVGKKYPCDICSKEFSEKGEVRRHIRRVHKGLNKSKSTTELDVWCEYLLTFMVKKVDCIEKINQHTIFGTMTELIYENLP